MTPAEQLAIAEAVFICELADSIKSGLPTKRVITILIEMFGDDCTVAALIRVLPDEMKRAMQ
jgi:hypothetical protein